uniref:Uncharacterized protein n=1 Tax=Aegilops tauschii subsp. strangulata TaxID=200361 RepID=A0A453HAV2_AEGTS
MADTWAWRRRQGRSSSTTSPSRSGAPARTPSSSSSPAGLAAQASAASPSKLVSPPNSRSRPVRFSTASIYLCSCSICIHDPSSSCTAGPVKYVLAPYTGGLPQLVHNPLSWTKVRSTLINHGAQLIAQRVSSSNLELNLWFTDDDDDQMASIIFLDSPVCSGFSYARDPKGCDVGDYSSSLQVQRFLNKVTIELAQCNNSVPLP